MFEMFLQKLRCWGWTPRYEGCISLLARMVMLFVMRGSDGRVHFIPNVRHDVRIFDEQPHGPLSRANSGQES